MKKIAQTILNTQTKEGIALYTQQYFDKLFEVNITNKRAFLDVHMKYFLDQSVPENITKQSLAKATFPRWSEPKNNILASAKNQTNISDKLILEQPTEKTDFRGFGELLLASDFANAYSEIKKIAINSENPNKPVMATAVAVIGSKNSRPDLTLYLQNQVGFMLDAKSGNNANHPFSGVAAHVPYTRTMQPYTILNDKPVVLSKIQTQRVETFQTQDSSHGYICKELYDYIVVVSHIENITEIDKNKLIQEKMFALLTNEFVSKRKPSFFHAYLKDDNKELNLKFYQQLEPHITPEIFHSKENAFSFIKVAAKSYHENIKTIGKKIETINNGGFGDTGFNDIDLNAFK